MTLSDDQPFDADDLEDDQDFIDYAKAEKPPEKRKSRRMKAERKAPKPKPARKAKVSDGEQQR